METSRIDNQVPFMATHPTEIIKDEIKERGMSQKELAERLGMQASNNRTNLRYSGDSIQRSWTSLLSECSG